MNNKNNSFSVRLANGRQETFATAAEMAAWLDLNRDYERKRKPRTKLGVGRSKQQRNRKRRTSSNEQKDGSPLARYANRNSGEA